MAHTNYVHKWLRGSAIQMHEIYRRSFVAITSLHNTTYVAESINDFKLIISKYVAQIRLLVTTKAIHYS